LEKSAHQFCVPIENTLAVGDTKSDICMIQRARVGVAFVPKDEEIKKASDKVVSEPDLLKVMNFVNKAF
jgi:phosphoserine phosphatase